MTDVCIVVLCGLPASGKTSFVKTMHCCLDYSFGEADELRWPERDLASPLHLPNGTSDCVSRRTTDRGVPDDLIPVIQILHVCYDELMPKEVETELLKQVPSDTSSSQWKDYRKQILDCVDCVIKDKDVVAGSEVTFPFSVDTDEWLLQKFQELVLESASKTVGSVVGRYAVIIDDNMYYKSMRYQYFQLARKCKN